MSKKLVLVLLGISLGSLAIFIAATWSLPPADVEPKGSDSSVMLQILSLATAIVSLLTAIIGLLKSTVKA